MKFIFWQNIVSIHQSALISTLAASHEVILVVEQPFLSSRKKSGWSIPDMGETLIISAPSDGQISSLVDSSAGAIHVFSGISAFPMVYKAFKIAVSKRRQVIVYAEPYEYEGLKGTLRRIKYSFLNLRYGRRIHAFLATGQTGVRAFLKAGFSSRKVFEWAYFTSEVPYQEPYKRKGYRVLYIGDLIPLKRIIELTSVLIDIEAKAKRHVVGQINENKKIHPYLNDVPKILGELEEFTIVGDGSLRKELMDLIKGHKFIHYLGTIPNSEIRTLIGKYDLLVLPSRYDGWGAVVNEALQAGTRVLCSNTCGASTLLDGEERGGNFCGEKHDR